MKKPMLLREYIIQTGKVPPGLELIQDSVDFKPLDMKRSSAKTIVEGKAQTIPIMRCTGVFQRADQRNANGRIYPFEIIKEAVAKLQPAIQSRKVVGEYDHPCLVVKSLVNCRVLTVDGWKAYDQVKVGDFVYSRVNGQMIPSRVNAVINERYKGKAYRLEGRHIDAEFTAPHKMILDSRSDGGHQAQQIEVTVDELFKDRKKFNKHRIPRTADWSGSEQEVYVIPGIKAEELHNESVEYYKNIVTEPLQIDTKTFVSFLGLWLAEGSLVSNTGIMIYQIKPDYKPLIKQMLSGFPRGLEWTEVENGFYLADIRLRKFLEKLGDKYNKYIPQDIKQLDGKYLEELVYWFQIGDGRQKHGRSNVFSVSEKLINDLHECWVKAGHCCYRTTIITENDYEFAGHIIKAEDKQPLHQLTLSYTTGIHCDDRFLKVTPREADEDIWCLTTEHGSFYMENYGCSFWTGNCDAKIHLDRISHLVTRLWMEGKTVFGELEVINDPRCPCGAAMACLLDRNIQVGISSRGVGDMELVECDGEDAYQVQNGFEFITFDSVAEPSVTGTQLNVVATESKQSKVAVAASALTEGKKRLIRTARESLIVNEFKKFLME